jgi:hypothetical protein
MQFRAPGAHRYSLKQCRYQILGSLNFGPFTGIDRELNIPYTAMQDGLNAKPESELIQPLARRELQCVVYHMAFPSSTPPTRVLDSPHSQSCKQQNPALPLFSYTLRHASGERITLDSYPDDRTAERGVCLNRHHPRT